METGPPDADLENRSDGKSRALRRSELLISVSLPCGISNEGQHFLRVLPQKKQK
jgi:hypothetical protein